MAGEAWRGGQALTRSLTAIPSCKKRHPGGRQQVALPPPEPKPKGDAKNGLLGVDQIPPFQAGTAHRVPINGQEALALWPEGVGGGRNLGTSSTSQGGA